MNKKRMLEEVAVVLEEEESKANTPAETLSLLARCTQADS